MKNIYLFSPIQFVGLNFKAVKFSTRTRYGIRTMLEIGMNYEKGGILQKDIAKNQEISYRTLDHLIQSLKNAELVIAARSENHTFTLSKHPSQITMLDIQQAIEPSICIVDCLSPHFSCDRSVTCTAKDFWCGLNEQIINYFKGITLQDMIVDQRKKLSSKKAI